MNIIRTAAAAAWAAALATNAAAAQEPEFFVLGLGFSKHANKDGAGISQPARWERQCTETWPGRSECKNVMIEPARRRWHEVNPALGIESTHESERGLERHFVQVVRDSYGEFGVMGGYGLGRPLYRTDQSLVDAGVSAGLWWRTNRHGRRYVTPFVLPYVSGVDRSTGIGFNLAVAPKIHLGDLVDVPTWTVMAQLKFRVNWMQ